MDRIISMILRRVMGRAINMGMKKGFDALSGDAPRSSGDRQSQKAARQGVKRARQAMRLTRRIGRF